MYEPYTYYREDPDPDPDEGDTPFLQGYYAYESHLPIDSNPYPPESDGREEWEAGWAEARELYER